MAATKWSYIVVRTPDVNTVLTVFLRSPVVSYSTGIQQPMRATAVLGRRAHTRWAAPADHEQVRAGSLHPEGRCSVDQTWTEREVCS